MLKKSILNFLVKTNAFAALRYKNRTRVPILTYHRFSFENNTFSTSQIALESHLKYITKHYEVISLQLLTEKILNKEPTRNKTLVITIDDGYKDVYDIAFPILKKFAVPATVFAVTDFLDKKTWIWTDKARYLLINTKLDSVNFNIASKDFSFKLGDKTSRINYAAKINSELKKLSTEDRDLNIEKLANLLNVKLPDLPDENFSSFTWDNAREMENNGVTVESHTVSHPILTNVSDEVLKNELLESKFRVQTELQKDADLFCYPNGNCSSREFLAVESAGYKSAVSTELRLSKTTDNIFSLPRVDCDSDMNRFIQSTSGFEELKTNF